MFVFVNAHFHPHDEGLRLRLEDFKAISEQQILNDTDYIFWCGDLNFRIDEEHFNHSQILEMIKTNQLHELFTWDQLNLAKQSNQAFGDYFECEPNFNPTFKFELGKKSYASKRRPAWTDRILYKLASPRTAANKENVVETEFEAFHDITVSDHRPVAGSFKVRVFNADVEPKIVFDRIERWKMNLPHTVYFKLNNFDMEDGDNVLLLKSRFMSVESFLSKTAVNPSNPKVTFPAYVIKQPGEYILLYVNTDSTCYYGISEPFRIKKKKNKGPKLCKCC